jgi:hypothetical protein
LAVDILSRRHFGIKGILSRDILKRDILSRDILSRDILSRDILSRDILPWSQIFIYIPKNLNSKPECVNSMYTSMYTNMYVRSKLRHVYTHTKKFIFCYGTIQIGSYEWIDWWEVDKRKTKKKHPGLAPLARETSKNENPWPFDLMILILWVCKKIT